jgi:hypothetical protein
MRKCVYISVIHRIQLLKTLFRRPLSIGRADENNIMPPKYIYIIKHKTSLTLVIIVAISDTGVDTLILLSSYLPYKQYLSIS